MSEDAQVNQVRAFLYHLFRSFFVSEPDEKLYASWQKILSSLPSVEFDPFDRALERLREVLARSSPQEIGEEFYRLFLDPFSEERVTLEASAYLDGKPFGPTLVRLREFLKRTGLHKKEQVKEPEDHLVLLLDFMETLVRDGKDLISQRELFYNYLRPCALGVTKKIRQSEEGFYQALAEFLEAFLTLEERFFTEEV